MERRSRVRESPRPSPQMPTSSTMPASSLSRRNAPAAAALRRNSSAAGLSPGNATSTLVRGRIARVGSHGMRELAESDLTRSDRVTRNNLSTRVANDDLVLGSCHVGALGPVTQAIGNPPSRNGCCRGDGWCDVRRRVLATAATVTAAGSRVHWRGVPRAPHTFLLCMRTLISAHQVRAAALASPDPASRRPESLE